MFEVGDHVYVVKKCIGSNDTPYWADRMDEYVNNGIAYQITEMNGNWYVLNTGWVFSAKSLELAFKDTKEVKVERKIKYLWNKSNYVKKNPHFAY